MLRCATHLARAARHVRPSPRSLGWEAIRARCKAGPPRSTRTTATSRILHLITFGNKLAAYILRELGKQRPSRPLNARLRTRTKEDEGGKRQLTTSVLFLSFIQSHAGRANGRRPGWARRHRAHLVRCHQKVQVVAHQHIRMQPASETQQRVAHALHVALAILVVRKAWQSIVAPLHDVLPNSGEVVAWKSGHAASIAGESLARRSVHGVCEHRPGRRSGVRNCP